ncbi:MAG TPA: HIT domain-containing protein [Solirubrobacteraceae bacterium]|nr:HIT domain-containing protein [Solirubrobacteraceae bacterium]
MSKHPLWAPWRIEYVTGEKSGECIFCAAARGEGADGGLVLDRGRQCFAMLNSFPYASGHTMVVPYRHVGDLLSLGQEELGEIMQLAQRIVRALTAVMSPEGFNIGLNLGEAAGAGIAEHLHLHVVPRWAGDTNFMPVLAETNVLPQALEATRDALAAALAEVP